MLQNGLFAERQKYNSTLETLEMSSNPCCGPSHEGVSVCLTYVTLPLIYQVSALRAAFTVNTALKRLFLSDTLLSTESAISLAEFLPESKSLLHLDITTNPIETAGVLALSVGLRSNRLIRCLDLSIPPNSPELAELSQSILQSCIRNTELAATALEGKASKHASEAIWGPIKKSALVRDAKRADQDRAEQEREQFAFSPEGMAREYVYTLSSDRLPQIAKAISQDLQRWYDAGKLARERRVQAWEPDQLPADDFPILHQRAKALRERIIDAINGATDPSDLADLLSANDDLTSHIESGLSFRAPPRVLLPSQVLQIDPGTTPRYATGSRRHMRSTSLEISSPNFSIGDSDGDSDAEELDVQRIQPQKATIGIGIALNDDIRLPLDDGNEPLVSPALSKAMVEEEGEIFRKGMKLGVVEDGDESAGVEGVDGEVLKQEASVRVLPAFSANMQILDTPVARSPTRRVLSVEESEDTASPSVDANE